MKTITTLLLLLCFHCASSQCTNTIAPLSQVVSCSGGGTSVSFTASAITPSVNIRHDWYSPLLPSGPAILSSTNAVSVLTGTFSPGVYTVVTTDLGTLCQVQKTFTITSPDAFTSFSISASSASVGCNGGATTLSIINPISTQTPPATTSYTFLAPSFTGVITPSVGLGANGSTLATAPGSWTVVVQDNSNLCRTFLPYSLSASSTSISFSHSVGAAGSVSFQSTSTGTNAGTIYNWDFGDGSAGSGLNPVHTYSNGGTHTVVLSTSNPACNSNNIPVNVNTLPCTANSGFTLNYSGTPQNWFAIPNYFGNVTNTVWNWGDGSSTNALFPSHTYSAAGLYNICLTVTVSCASTSSTCAGYNIFKFSENKDMAMVTVSVIPKMPTGIKKYPVETSDFGLYPNPANEFLYLELADEKSRIEPIVTLAIYNNLGQLIKEEKVSLENNKGSINISDLPKGFYILKFDHASTSLSMTPLTKRFLIAR